MPSSAATAGRKAAFVTACCKAGLALAAAAAAALCCSGPAYASGPPGGSTAIGPIATDGERLVAWVAEPGVVRIASEQTGTITETSAPERCADRLSELRVGGGHVALLCWDGARIRSRLVMLELATGVWRDLADPDQWRRQLGGGLSLLGVGARWLQLGTDAGAVLVDVRDGSLHDAAGLRPATAVFAGPPSTHRDLSARGRAAAAGATALDLDAEQPYVPACAPLLQPPVAYAPPYALTASGRAIAFWRCGSPRPITLDDRVTDPQLGSGVASWQRPVGNATARAYVSRCRLIAAWRGWSFDGIAHTSEALYTSSAGRLRRLPLPHRCPRPATLRIRAVADRTWTRVPAQLWPTRAAGRPLALRPPHAAATVPVVRRHGAPLELLLPHPASSVISRIGSRRSATMPATDRRRWRLPGPRSPGRTRITIEARDDRGAVTQRYLLTVVSP